MQIFFEKKKIKTFYKTKSINYNLILKTLKETVFSKLLKYIIFKKNFFDFHIKISNSKICWGKKIRSGK